MDMDLNLVVYTGDISRHWDPVADDVWGVGITWDMVHACLSDVSLRIDTPVGANSDDPMIHAGRIAWLAMNSWPDPVQLEFTHQGFRVEDGNHRLAAAILRGDMFIEVSIGGYLDIAEEFLGSRAGFRNADCNLEDSDHELEPC